MTGGQGLRQVALDWLHAVIHLIAAPVIAGILVERTQGPMWGALAFALIAAMAVYVVHGRYSHEPREAQS